MTWTHRLLIVPVDWKPLAKALAEGIAGRPETLAMWMAPFSPTGQLPATHYVSAGMIHDTFAELLGDAEKTAKKFKDKGGEEDILPSVKELYKFAIIRDDAQFRELAVLEELGLFPIRLEEL